MIINKLVASSGIVLSNEAVLSALQQGLEGQFRAQKVLVLIPDHTRSLPLPFLFRSLVNILQNARQLDFMVALGTHPPLTEGELNRLVGISIQDRNTSYKHVGLLNHAWNDPAALMRLGTISEAQVKAAILEDVGP